MGMDSSIQKEPTLQLPIKMYYLPVLQENYIKSIIGALRSALQIIESKLLLSKLTGGFENKSVFILKYQNYQLIKAN